MRRDIVLQSFDFEASRSRSRLLNQVLTLQDAQEMVVEQVWDTTTTDSM